MNKDLSKYLAIQMGNQIVDLSLKIAQLQLENDDLRLQLSEYQRKGVKHSESTSDHATNRQNNHISDK